MALAPLLPGPRWAGRYLRLLRIDDVFCDGPYPMIFSGILQKGHMNEHLVRRLRRTPAGRETLVQISAAHRAMCDARTACGEKSSPCPGVSAF